MKAPVYLIYNETDGVFASPDKMTLAEAQVFVAEFPKRYQGQGTADCIRINPTDVKLSIIIYLRFRHI